MSFIDRFAQVLKEADGKALITEVHGEELKPFSGHDLLNEFSRARGFLRSKGVGAGDRVVLLAPNSAAWVAIDVAILAEGAICVPMYARQDPKELVEMMRDCDPALVVCANNALSEAVSGIWAEAPTVTFEAVLAHADGIDEVPVSRADDDPVTIIYTSGTSGKPKGVVLSVKNVNYMLPIIAKAVDGMMAGRRATQSGDDRVFHYLPFCFAGSRMVLWMCLFRANGLMVSTDLNNLAVEFRTAKPNYFLNVPALLERIKNGVEGKVRQRNALIQALYDKGLTAFAKIESSQASVTDRVVYGIAKRLVFNKIHEQIGAQLECLICGSAPLGEDTQRWFSMVGINVYQVYGLTETTAIVTMDSPGDATGGRVGFVIEGCQTRVSTQGELLVSGPNIFQGYWNNSEATAEAFDENGWFRTGDQVDFDGKKNLRIVGRVRNLLVPSSGHNVAPEPIEQKIIETIEGVEQAVVIGHARPFLTALVTGDVDAAALARGIERVNQTLPHYRRVRQYHLSPEAFTPENGLLTANQKLRRGAIESHYQEAVESMYS